MRTIDDASLRALRGSRSGDKIIVFARYGSGLVVPDPLPIRSYSFSWDSTRQIQSFNCAVADESGKLAPWLLEDPLGVGGAVLDVRYEIGGAGQVNLGPYRVTKNVPEERWHTYIITDKGTVNPAGSSIPKDQRLLYVPGGANIQISAADTGRQIKIDRLLAPESPPTGSSPTIISEVKRLMRDIAAVTVGPGVVDRAVSPNIIYERDRMDAIQDLCKRIFCDFRFTGEGLLEVYSILEQAPVATLEGGPGGLLVRVDRSQDGDGLYNRFVVDGTRDLGDGKTEPIRSLVEIDSGPLSVFGPHGRSPEFYSSNLITSQEDADEYANQMALTQMSGLTVDLMVTCLPMPHIQHGDWVQVGNPIVNGESVPLVGRVKSVELKSGNGTAPGPMTVTVQCSYWTVATAISAAR